MSSLRSSQKILPVRAPAWFSCPVKFPLLSAALAAVLLSPALPCSADDAPKWQKVLPSTPPGVTCLTREVVVYPEHTVTLLVYVPNVPKSYPAILDIHGGGWSQRQVEQDRPLAERLASQGFVTAIVSYRLSTEAKYPAALDDCKAAVRYMRKYADEMKIDPARIGVIGGSAGGHLCSLLAMTNGLPEFEGKGPFQEQSSGVKACVVMAASQDLVTAYADKTPDGAVTFFGGTREQKPEIYAEASPITHVREGVPPTIFIEGEKDTAKIGRPEMMAKLKALGIETDNFTLLNAPHPFWMSQPWLDQTVEIATKFFKKHLGEPK